MSFIKELELLLVKIRKLQHLSHYFFSVSEAKEIQIIVDKIIHFRGMRKFSRIFRGFDASDYAYVRSGTNEKLLDTCERIVELLITEVNTWSKTHKRTNSTTEGDNNLTLKLPFFEAPVTNRESLIFVLGLIIGFLASLLLFVFKILYIA